MCPFLETKDTAGVSGADSRRPLQGWNYDELGLYNMYKTVDKPKPAGWLTLTVGVEGLSTKCTKKYFKPLLVARLAGPTCSTLS